jgi:hypothetical protein
LDESNGRFCVTPEYPEGVYAYLATVDENWNSVYPYAVGPVFYGNVVTTNVNSISETVTNYIGDSTDTTTGITSEISKDLDVTIFPNPATDLIAVQMNGVVRNNTTVQLMDLTGKIISTTTIRTGSTISYIDTKTCQSGNYIVRVGTNKGLKSENIIIQH